MDQMKAKIARGAVWLIMARGGSSLIALCSTLVLARLLAPADFGLVALATTMLAILSAVTEMSLASALVNHPNPTEEHFNTAWSLNMARALFIGLIFCAASYPAARIYHEPRLAGVMIVLGLTMTMNGASNPKMITFSRNLVFKQDFALNLSSKVAGFVTALVVAVMYRSYWALVAGSVAIEVTMITVSYCILPYRPRLTWRHARELWSFSVWLTLSQAVNTVNFKSDQFLIGTFVGRVPLGFYTVGDNLAATVTREATAPLTQTLFPAFTALRADRTRLRQAYVSVQKTVSAISLPIGIGTALVADPLVRLVMGEKWLPAVIAIQVLSCVFGLQTIGSLVQPLALALGETKRLFTRDTMNFLIRFPTILAGLFLGGWHGVVYARLFSGGVAIVINLWLVRELVGISMLEQVRGNFRALASVAVMAAVVATVGRAYNVPVHPSGQIEVLARLVGIGFIIYVTTSWLLWRVAGRPDGAERIASISIQRLTSRLRA